MCIKTRFKTGQQKSFAFDTNVFANYPQNESFFKKIFIFLFGCAWS